LSWKKSNEGSVTEVDQLVGELEELKQEKDFLLVAIDGCGGSGKSTLALLLEGRLGDVTVVEGDYFYLPTAERPVRKIAVEQPGSAYDWRRLLAQVLQPLTERKDARYQKYEWRSDTYEDWCDIPREGMVIVEGVYVSRPEVSDLYDYRVWVNCPREIRLARGVERDGKAHRDLWENEWMAAENRYVKMHTPEASADFVIDGSKNF
jgi:uridine kinase